MASVKKGKENVERMLDLGCGRVKFNPNAVGVDCHRMEGVDVVTDLNSLPYPFSDESFDYIHASHILEHLENTIKVMEEIYRILRPSGRVLIRTPHFSNQMAYCHPQHIRFFSLGSFDCFSGDNPEYTKAKFVVEKKELHWSCVSLKNKKVITEVLNRILNFLGNLNNRICERYWIYWVGGFEELEVVLRKE